MKPTIAQTLSIRSVPRRAFLAGAVGAVISSALQTTPSAANAVWPTRTVRLITLGQAGAGTDAVARTLAEALSRHWEKPVIVDNRPGGEGIVSIETFLAAREGNHTLLFNPTGVWTAIHLLHERLSFDPPRDLIPLSFVAQDFLALAASPRLGATTLADIVTTARAKPGALNWSCAPSIPFLAFNSFLKENGLALTYVAYKSPVASLPDLAEGRVDLAFLPLPSLIGAAQAGNLRLVAVASDQRAPLAPDVPTATEAGFPALSFFAGHCVYAPKEMPEALRSRIATDVREVMANPDIARRLTSLGLIPRTESTTEVVAILERERARWTEVAQKYGAKPSQ